jgi:hypothetical protein
LEAALYANTLGYPVTVYERGQVGEYLRRWGHVRLFTPFGMNVTSLGRSAILSENSSHAFPADSSCITGREHLAVYLEPLAKTEPLRKCIRKETRILSIGRKGLLKEDDPGDPKRAKQPFRLLIRDSNKRDVNEEAEIIMDCTGTYGQHRWVGDGGIPAAGELNAEQHITYSLDDILGERRAHFAGKTIMVVGGGYSAATTVCNLATVAEQQIDTWVIWLARCAGTQPLPRIPNDPLRERDRLAVRANTLATRGDGNVEFHNQSFVEAVECPDPNKGLKITARCGGKTRTWEVDRLIANVGYSPDITLYRELRVHEPEPEPNYFILGAKSYGRNSNFFLGNGFDQIRKIFALIAGKPDLNLYKTPR